MDQENGASQNGEENISSRQDYGEILIASEQAIKLNPENSYAYCDKGMALYQPGRYQEAFRANQKAGREKRRMQ